MNVLLAVSTVVGVDAIAIAYLARWHRTRDEQSWFDHRRFLNVDLAARVTDYSRRRAIVHPCSAGGDMLEFPIVAGWDEDAILHTLAEIEAL